MVEPLRHRQTKEAETDMLDLKPPRYISTLPIATLPQEFMSAMPAKADKPEPTRMTRRRHWRDDNDGPTLLSRRIASSHLRRKTETWYLSRGRKSMPPARWL